MGSGTASARWSDGVASAERERAVAVVPAAVDLSAAHRAPLADLPLHVHGTYTLDEILAAFDERNSKDGVKRIQTGVYFVERLRADLLFVTLYKDHATSATHFMGRRMPDHQKNQP